MAVSRACSFRVWFLLILSTIMVEESLGTSLSWWWVKMLLSDSSSTHTHTTHIIIILCVKHRRWHFVWSSVEIRTVEASWACVFLHIPWPTLLIRCVNLINIMDNCLHGRELRQPPCSDRMCKYCSFTIGALNTDICRNALKSHLQMTPGLLGLHLSFWWICSLSLMESEKAFCTSSYHLTAVATHPRGGGTSTNKDTIPCNHMLTDSAFSSHSLSRVFSDISVMDTYESLLTMLPVATLSSWIQLTIKLSSWLVHEWAFAILCSPTIYTVFARNTQIEW